MQNNMKLYAAPLSHFSRKVRILLDLYSVPYEMIDVGNVAEGSMEKFGGNPLLRVPVLTDGWVWIVDSDNIANFIVQKCDPADRYQVGTRDVSDLNIRAVLNGMMSEEVTVIIARRTSVPTEQYSFFDDALDAVKNGLAWLESNAERFNVTNPTYKEFHLVCLWDHLAHYDFVPLEYEKLARIVGKVSEHPVIKQSAPRRL